MNQQRFLELKYNIRDYLKAKPNISTGIEIGDEINNRKEHIKRIMGATEEQWRDYRWQFEHMIDDVTQLFEIYPSLKYEKEDIYNVSRSYRMRISPYYLSLIDLENPDCPIKKMAIPSTNEYDDCGELDPMSEQEMTIGGVLTRRYPDRVILKVTNCCATFCRFCQRRRLIGEMDHHAPEENMDIAIDYIKNNTEIRDVLITGGDPLMLEDGQLDKILCKIREIQHVEIIRIGTRMPVTLPQRITTKLVDILKKYQPIYISTHFNHPNEITDDARRACLTLANAGIPLNNQSVFLKDVNDDAFVVRKLNESLLRILVKPYYIFHPKFVKGTKHFWISIDKGLSIIESLRGRTSGLAIPTYVFNAPKGYGKIPLLPDYIQCNSSDKIEMKTWEGRTITVYKDINKYE